MFRIFPLSPEREFQSTKDSGTIILGGPLTAKTSLLFQAALSLSAQGKRVVFIRPNKFVNLPNCVKNMTKPTHTTMKLIKFLYLNSSDLVKYLSEVHLSSSTFDAILVDDMQCYVQANDDNLEHALAKLLALFKDTVSYLSLKTNETCIFMSTVTENNRQSIYARIGQIFFHLWQINTCNEFFSIISYPDTKLKIYYEVKDEISLKEVKRNSEN
ncbi:ATPase SWSAP1-like [Centruroides sculpturatus]|uniref:ATPase SWSAP1-like n=1 Tax=Centruroides sculpturatus TaxID=218467 RepID=UPI000C6E7603|nr:ATPase SWSAP1-like [Centruroides sculpturatus]